MSPPDLTVIVPVFDEEPAIEELHLRLRRTLDSMARGLEISSEILAVNDGSRDGSLDILRRLAAGDRSLRIIELPGNRGQHEAVLAGFAAARSPLLVTIDADLQNPPEEIPRIVEALLAGHDLVATRRTRREDPLSRRFASSLANFTSAALTRLHTSVPLHDIGCMLRGYRGELVAEMLRVAAAPGAPAPFIPALAVRCARRVCEIDVEHARRSHGRSRYGWTGLLGLQARLVATLIKPPCGRS